MRYFAHPPAIFTIAKIQKNHPNVHLQRTDLTSYVTKENCFLKTLKNLCISLGWKELAYSTSPGVPKHNIVAHTHKSFAQEAAEGQDLG